MSIANLKAPGPNNFDMEITSLICSNITLPNILLASGLATDANGMVIPGSGTGGNLTPNAVVQTDSFGALFASNILTTITLTGDTLTDNLIPSLSGVSNLGSAINRYDASYLSGFLDITNGSGPGNWGFINISGDNGSTVTINLGLTNTDTNPTSGCGITLTGTDITSTTKVATIQYTGDDVQIIADTLGVSLVNGGTSWASLCSKHLKDVVDSDVDHEKNIELLGSMPIDRWTYKADLDRKENIGPYAEDIYELFNLGDGKKLTTLELDGVQFSCLKGLLIKQNKQEQRIKQLEEMLYKAL